MHKDTHITLLHRPPKTQIYFTNLLKFLHLFSYFLSYALLLRSVPPSSRITEANAIVFVPFSEDRALISITILPFSAYYATEINFTVMNGSVA